jgi:hypothetical protein
MMAMVLNLSIASGVQTVLIQQIHEGFHHFLK